MKETTKLILTGIYFSIWIGGTILGFVTFATNDPFTDKHMLGFIMFWGFLWGGIAIPCAYFGIIHCIKLWTNAKKIDVRVKRNQSMEMFWELGRAQYLTIPRSIIQEMPMIWQNNLARLLNELDATFDWRPENGRYYVELRVSDDPDDENPVTVPDPLMEYRHGNQHAKSLKIKPST